MPILPSNPTENVTRGNRYLAGLPARHDYFLGFGGGGGVGGGRNPFRISSPGEAGFGDGGAVGVFGASATLRLLSYFRLLTTNTPIAAVPTKNNNPLIPLHSTTARSHPRARWPSFPASSSSVARRMANVLR
jgi:hypothetical protein